MIKTEKEILIKEIVEKLKKENSILDMQTNPIIEETGISFLEDISPYFNQLDNITSYSFTAGWDCFDDIFYKISQFKNIEKLQIDFSDLSEIEKNVDDGLKLLPKLKHLTLMETNLSKFPKSILKMETLERLSIKGNKFYTQNFHFRKKKSKRIDKIIIDEIKKMSFPKYHKQIHRWGVYLYSLEQKKTEVLILKDINIKELELEDAISIYVLNEKNKYKTFNEFHNLFKELNKTDGYFKITKKDQLEVFFLKEDNEGGMNNLIDYQELRKTFFNYEKEYNAYQVIDLLNEFGGEELILELYEERKNNKLRLSEEFQKNKFIENVKIENFKIFEKEHQVNLSEINIIIGKNSTGKTSILQAIALGLVPENTNQITQNTEEKYTNFINQKITNSKIKELHKAKISLKWKTDNEKNKKKFNRKYILNDLSVREQYVYSEKLLADKEIPKTYLVLGYGENLFPDREASEYEAYNFIDYLKTGDYNSISVESLFVDYYKKLINPLYILNKLQKNELPSGFSKSEVEELTAIKNELFKTLNLFLNVQQADSFEIKLIDNRYKFIDNSENKFDLYQLSEGYRTNISLVTDILIKIFASRNNLFLEPYKHTDFNKILKKVRGTILIDEFDKHLHPVWQKSFVGILKEQLPKIQFVLTTHNVVALQSAEGQTAIKLSANEKGKIIIEEKIIQKGNSIETLLNLFFDWNSQFYGNETEEKLNEFYSLIEQIYENKEIDNERLKILISELTDNEQSEEIRAIIGTEKAQVEAVTGKKIIK